MTQGKKVIRLFLFLFFCEFDDEKHILPNSYNFFPSFLKETQKLLLK